MRLIIAFLLATILAFMIGLRLGDWSGRDAEEYLKYSRQRGREIEKQDSQPYVNEWSQRRSETMPPLGTYYNQFGINSTGVFWYEPRPR